MRTYFRGINSYTGDEREAIRVEFLKMNMARTQIALAALFILELINITFGLWSDGSRKNSIVYFIGFAVLIAVSLAYSLLLWLYGKYKDNRNFASFLNLSCWIFIMIGALVISYAESADGSSMMTATIFTLSIGIIPVMSFYVIVTFLGVFSLFNILFIYLNHNPLHIIREIVIFGFISLVIAVIQYYYTLNIIGEYVLLNNKNKKLVELSERDPLTGILNRRGFSNIIQEYGKSGTRFAVMMVDIDNFKNYNDRYYHDAGDLCLQKVASALARSIFRKEDLVVRYGGEEFLVYLHDIDKNDVVSAAERIQNEIALMRIDLGNDNKYVTVSIGVAFRPENGKSDINSMIAEADKELYNAKKNGKDCISFAGKIIRSNPIWVSQAVSEDVAKTLRVQPQHYGKKNVLVIDAEDSGGSLLSQLLEPEYSVVPAEGVNTALKILSNRNSFISAVIIGVGATGDGLLDILNTARTNDSLKNIPIIVACGSEARGIEKDALKSGAWDFVSLPCDASVIKFRIKNAIERSQLPAFNQLKYLAEYDALTGIFNKNQFLEEVREILSISNSDNYALIRFDISRFQLINSFFGFEEGDKLLKYLAHATSDYGKFLYEYSCGRIEADTFAVLIPYENNDSVNEFVDYIKNELKKYPIEFDIIPTFGVYVITNRLMPASSMLDKASLAAKEAKVNYLSGCAYYTDDMGKRLLVEQELINEMNEALEGGQFVLYIQPKYRLETEEPSGGEALVRWKHPEKGIISPGAFIPVFERNGFIVKLDYYMWESVCKKLGQWIHEGYEPMPVSVNVSRVNLYSADLVDTLCSLTEKYGVPNSMLNLEITESVYTKNPEIMREMIKKLRSRGFVVMMDDFGSGYSSLNMLKDIEVDVLKIDVKFLADTRNEARSRSIISSVVGMAKRLSLMTVAEGVEKKEQAEFLAYTGCDFAQGYYFARPMPCDEYEKNIVISRQKPDTAGIETAGGVI